MQTHAQPEPQNPQPEGASPRGPIRSIVESLVRVITQHGLSDSAAARACSIGTSTISRWKQQEPELAYALLRAREEFRQNQLAIITSAANRSAGGWRAAAWLLERIFPEDYARNPKDRAASRNLAPSEPEDVPPADEYCDRVLTIEEAAEICRNLMRDDVPETQPVVNAAHPLPHPHPQFSAPPLPPFPILPKTHVSAHPPGTPTPKPAPLDSPIRPIIPTHGAP